jgi:ubiquinone/menaquinone biosynthesis C-methylase UbiE
MGDRARWLRLLSFEDGDAPDEDAVVDVLRALPAPRSPAMLMESFLALGAGRGDVVVDLGCGHGEFAVEIAERAGCRVVALDLSASRARETRDAARGASAGCIVVARAAAEGLPLRDAAARFIWCRDLLCLVDLPRTLADCARALTPGGLMLVYQTFATELLEPLEAARIYDAFAIVPENMNPEYFQATAKDAGFSVLEREVIGGEWREWWEAEGSGRTSRSLLRAARLVRAGDDVRRSLGADGYEFAMADQLWGVYQMIGKLRPMVYSLRRD